VFGRMTVTPIVQGGAGADLQVAITTLLRAADQPEIARWIEFPGLVLLFLFVPGDSESGAVYVLDRKRGTWYMVDFEDNQFGGYSVSQLDQLLRDTDFSSSSNARHFGKAASGGAWNREPCRKREHDPRLTEKISRRNYQQPPAPVCG
jgi:hypothetical protein